MSDITINTSNKPFSDVQQLENSAKVKQVEQFEQHSWLKTGHPFGEPAFKSWDQALACQLCSENFQPKAMEGQVSYDQALDYFLEFTGLLLQTESQAKLNLTEATRTRLQQFANEMKGMRESQLKINELIKAGMGKTPEERATLLNKAAHDFFAQFKKEKTGWFPSGIMLNKDYKLPIPCKINMDKGVTFVNTGVGSAESHWPATFSKVDPLTGELKSEVKWEQTYKIGKIKKEKMNDPAFFKALLEPLVQSFWGTELNLNPKFFYNSIETYLEGQHEAQVDPTEHPDMYKKKQRSVLGTVKNLSTILYYIINDGMDHVSGKDAQQQVSDFKKCKFLWQSQSLVKTCKSLPESNSKGFFGPQSWTKESLNIMEDSCANLARSAEKLAKSNTISAADLDGVEATLKDIRARIALVRETKKKSKNEVALADSKLQFSSAVTTTTSEALTLPKPITVHEGKIAPQGIIGLITEVYQPHSPINTPVDALEWLTIYEEKLQKLNKYNLSNSVALKYGLTDLLAKIPAPSHAKDSFWNKIPQEQVVACMEKIRKLSQIKPGKTEYGKHSSKSSVLQYTLFGIMDQLARRLPETKLQGYPTPNMHGLLLEVKSHNFQINHPTFAAKLTDVLHYFIPNYDLKKVLHDPQSIDSFKSEAAQAFLGFCTEVKYSKQTEILVMNSRIDSGSMQTETMKFFKQFFDQLPADKKAQIVKELEKENSKIKAKALTYNHTPILFDLSLEMQIAYFITKALKEENWLPESVRAYFLSSVETSLLTFAHSSKITTAALYPQKGHAQLAINHGGGHHSFKQPPNLSPVLKSKELYDSFKFEKALAQGIAQNELYPNISENEHINNLMSLKGTIKALGLEQQQVEKLLMISADPFDEVNRAIAFAREYPELLTKPFVQRVLRMHLFRAERMHSQLNDNPKFLHTLNEFLKEIWGHHKQTSNWTTCFFVAQLGNNLANLLGQKHFPQFASLITQELLPLLSNPQDQFKAYEAIASMYEQTTEESLFETPGLAEQLTIDLLQVMIHKKMYACAFTSTEDEKAFEYTYSRFKPYIDDLLSHSSESCSKIMNALLKKVSPTAPPENWKKEGPKLVAENFSFDLYYGIFSTKKDEAFTAMPAWIRNTQPVKDFCKGGIDYTLKIAENRYMIYPQKLLVTWGLNNSLEVSKEINGKRYIYMHLPTALRDLAPNLFLAKYEYWVDEGGTELLVRSGEDQMFHCELAKNDLDATVVKKVVRPDGMILVPFDELHSSLHFLVNYEGSKEYIEAWKSPADNEVKIIYMPRRGLRFSISKVEGQPRAFCQQMPGFFLVPEKPLQGIPSKIPCMHFMSHSGEHKVLLAKATLSVDVKATPKGVKRVINASLPQVSAAHPQAWVEYTEVEGNLVSSHNEANLYLINILLAQGNPLQAAKLLSEISSLMRYSAKEMAVFNNMFAFRQSQHPATMAFLLKLAVHLEENHLKYPLSIGVRYQPLFDSNTIKSLYVQYNSVKGNTAGCMLTEKEEKRLFSRIQREYNEQQAELKNLKNVRFWEAFSRRRELEQEFNVFKQQVGSRWDYILKGKTRLEADKVEKLELPQPISLPSNYLLKDTFEKFIFDDCKMPDYLLSQDGKTFKDQFWFYYDIATSGKKEDIEHLKKMLQMHSHLKNSHVFILERVLKNPKSYATIAQIKALAQEKEKYKNSNFYKPNDYKAYTNAVAKYDAVFNKIAASNTGAFVWEIVKTIFKMIGNAIAKSFKGFFKSDNYFKPKAKEALKTAISLDAKELKATEKAFTDYLGKLSTTYLDAKKPDPVKPTLLPEKHADKEIEKKLKEENADMLFYHSIEKEPNYSVKDGVKLDDLVKELQGKVTSWKADLKTQMASLVWMVNRVSSNPKTDQIHTIHNIGFNKHLDEKDLQKMFLDGTLETFMAKTHLSKEDIEKTFASVADYLVKMSRVQQMEHACNAVKKANEVGDAAEDASKKAWLVQHLGKTLNQVRSYEPSYENRAKLNFEVAKRYLYWKEQIAKMDEILGHKEPTLMMCGPTGIGKTDNIILSLNDAKAKEGYLVFNSWPASLEITNAYNAQNTMDKGFGKKVDRLWFDRSTNFTATSLEFLYEELLEDFQLGNPVSIRSESLRAFAVHFQLNLYEACQKDIDVEEMNLKIAQFMKILVLIRTKGWVTIDECDKVIDALDKLIYTLGKAKTLPDEQVAFIEQIFEFLISPEWAKVTKIQQNKQCDMTGDIWDKMVAPEVAKHFLKELEIAPENEQSYYDYVLGKVSNPPAWWDNHSKKWQIALLKGQLVYVLKNSCEGEVNKQFGRSKLHPEKEAAISYIFADTPKENEKNPSQLKNPHEALDKTYITYLYEGLDEKQGKKLLSFLQAQSIVEASFGGSFEATKANDIFKKIAPDAKKPLHALSAADIEELSKKVLKNTTAIFYYIRYIIAADQIKSYQGITSTPFNFLKQFASSLSLSATPQPEKAHSQETKFIPWKGASGKMTHLLLTKLKDPSKLHVFDYETPSQALDVSLDIAKNKKNLLSSVDGGALYKGLSSQKIAEKMIAKFAGTKDLEGVVFFDDESERLKLIDAAGNLMDLEDCLIKPEKRFTNLNHAHSFGTDVEQSAVADALLTFCLDMTVETAQQISGRQRKLDQGQGLEALIPKEMAKEAFKDGEKDIVQLVVNSFFVNSNKNAGKTMYDCIRAQMENELQHVLFDKFLGLDVHGKGPKDILDKEPNVGKAIAMMKNFQSEIVTSDSLDPIAMYAHLNKDMDVKDALDDYMGKLLKRVANLPGLSSNERKVVSDRIKAYQKLWKGEHAVHIQGKVTYGAADLGIECQVLEEVSVQVQEQTVKHTLDTIVEHEPWSWPKKMDLFSNNWMKPTRLSGAMHKITIGLRKMGQKWNAMISKAKTIITRLIAPIILVGLPALGAIGFALKVAFVANPILTGIILGGVVLLAGIIVGAVYLGRYLMRHQRQPIYTAQEVLKAHLKGKYAKGAEIFSSDFLVSNNFLLQKPRNMTENVIEPFTDEHKPLFELLVMKEKSGRVRIMAIDQNDSLYFRERLKEDQETSEEEAKKRDVKIGIYDLKNGLVSEGKNAFAMNELENSDIFQGLLAEAKLFDGQIQFNQKQIKHLANKADKVGKPNVGPLVTDYLLSRHKVNKAAFKSTPLALALTAAAA